MTNPTQAVAECVFCKTKLELSLSALRGRQVCLPPCPEDASWGMRLIYHPVLRLPMFQSCKSLDVIQIATKIQEVGRFSDLPILADALEEAGCDYADILDHLRAGIPHEHGCWVSDLIFAKE